jgi:ribosome-binding factor A
MKSHPRTRVAGEHIREAVARILLSQVRDPRVDLVTVTSCVVSPDLRHADVYVTAHGDQERYAEALAGLDSAKGRIRAVLGQEIRMKYVPELHFKIDESVDEGIRITQALRREYDAGRGPRDEADAENEERDALGEAGDG